MQQKILNIMKLLQTKDYLLLIDEESRGIEFGEIGVNMRHSNLEPETRNIGGYGSDKFYWSHKKIIAYYPLNSEAKELDLPLLPNPFEEDITKLAIQDLDDGEEGISNIDIKNWIKGYKAAQSKQFNSNDMILFAEYVGNYYADIHKTVIPTEELLNNFVQSLSTQQIPVGFIPEIAYHNLSIYDKLNGKPYLKTITNPEGKDEMQGSYKY